MTRQFTTYLSHSLRWVSLISLHVVVLSGGELVSYRERHVLSARNRCSSSDDGSSKIRRKQTCDNSSWGYCVSCRTVRVGQSRSKRSNKSKEVEFRS